MNLPGLPSIADAAEHLERWESGLDPARPERSGVRVLAYGEISATLVLPDPMFQGLVAKRMTGFPDEDSVAGYVDLVNAYCRDLRSAEVRVVETVVVPVPRAGRTPAVYLVQPQLPAAGLGNHLLHTVDDEGLTHMLNAALRAVDSAFAAGDDDLEIAIDAQLSNWWFPHGPGSSPLLMDVGTPFVRRGGVHLLKPRVLLSAVPPGIRSLYLWRRTGEKYMDDYFDRRLVGLDLLGNFIKEKERERIPVGLATVNAWLGREGPVSQAEVEKYFSDDAAALELFLRVRRADRWTRTKLLRRDYDYILPGRVHRG